jgi:Holliday junction resolvase RusA-like endonuclease
MLRSFAFEVRGVSPAPKGSYNIVTNRRTGKGMLLPSSKKEKPWRREVTKTILKHKDCPSGIAVPVEIWLDFAILRPKSVSVRKRPYPIVKPDLDKLQRSTLDALTDSHIIKDDAIITDIHATKRYVTSTKDQGLNCQMQWEEE